MISIRARIPSLRIRMLYQPDAGKGCLADGRGAEGIEPGLNLAFTECLEQPVTVVWENGMDDRSIVVGSPVDVSL